MKDTTYKNWKLCIKIYKTIFSIIQYCLLKASLHPSKIWQWVGDLPGGLFFNLKHRLFLGFYNDSLYPFALSIAIFSICSPLFVTSLCVISTNCCKAALPKNRKKSLLKITNNIIWIMSRVIHFQIQDIDCFICSYHFSWIALI